MLTALENKVLVVEKLKLINLQLEIIKLNEGKLCKMLKDTEFRQKLSREVDSELFFSSSVDAFM